MASVVSPSTGGGVTGGAGGAGKAQVTIGLAVGIVSQFVHWRHRSWAETIDEFCLKLLTKLDACELSPTWLADKGKSQ